VVDNVGGITPGLKIGVLAECHGMECMPHGVGNVLHQAAHLQCDLAMPNSAFVEVPYPQGARDAQPYVKDVIRIASDGYVYASSKPGLGYEIDRTALDKAITKIERRGRTYPLKSHSLRQADGRTVATPEGHGKLMKRRAVST
jgi:L-alanine-DL-glutamate epimerase-like enolase superfamily enzyme